MEHSEGTQSAFILDDLSRALPEGSSLCEKQTFSDVASFFSNVATEFDGDRSLFRDREFVARFTSGLQRFDQHLQRNIEKIRELVRCYGLEKFFPEGWDGRFEKGAYFIWFLHFGQKRRAEVDRSTGKDLDYAYHPLRVACSDFAEKIGLTDEEGLFSELFHDSFEDFEKGILGEKGLAIPKEHTPAVLKGIIDFIHGIYSHSYNSGRSIVADVGRMSKDPSAKKRSRVRPVFDLIAATCFCVEDSRDNEQILRSIFPLLEKMADVLDNIPSVRFSRKKGVEEDHRRMAEIKNEAIFLYLPMMEAFGMLNAKEWLYDFLYFSDSERRDEVYKMGKELQRSYDLLRYFQKDFEEYINEKIPGCKNGVHYVLNFRPRSLGKRSISRGAMLTDSGVRRNQMGFNNYILFICIDHGRASEICAAARDFFRETFSGEIPEDLYRTERSAQFGSKFNFGRDTRRGCVAKYGVGAYGVFESYEDVERIFYGDVHSAYHHENAESMQKLAQFFSRIVERVIPMSRELGILDALHEYVLGSSVEAVCSYVRSFLSLSHGRSVQRDFSALTSNEEDLIKILRLVDLKILALFAERMPVTVSVNGKEEHAISIPQESDVGCVLLHADVFLTYRKLSRVTIRRGDVDIDMPIADNVEAQRVLREWVSEGDSICFYFDLEDRGFQASNVKTISSSMRNDVLRSHKRKILQ